MGWWVGWAGELTCDARMTTEYSAVARAVLLLTIFQSCIPLAGLRQRRRLVLPLTVHHLRACRRPLDSSVARDARYRGIIFASDGVDGRSAERERKSPQPRSFQQRHKSSDPSHPRLRLQSVAGIKKTHGTRSVPDFLRFLGLFHNQVPAFLSKNGPKWANLISNPQFSSALRAGGTGFSYVFRRNPVPYFLMPVLLNARN